MSVVLLSPRIKQIMDSFRKKTAENFWRVVEGHISQAYSQYHQHHIAENELFAANIFAIRLLNFYPNMPGSNQFSFHF